MKHFTFISAPLLVLALLVQPPKINPQKILSPIFLGSSSAINGGGGGNTPWITTQTLGTGRNNYTGCVGVFFTVGASNITVTDLGRWVISGNTGSHLLMIITPTGGTSVVSGTVNTSGATAAQYLYVSVTPTLLSASTQYFLTSQETDMGDYWYDQDTTVNTYASGAGSPISGYVGTCPNTNPATQNAGAAYVPLNFKYHL